MLYNMKDLKWNSKKIKHMQINQGLDDKRWEALNA